MDCQSDCFSADKSSQVENQGFCSNANAKSGAASNDSDLVLSLVNNPSYKEAALTAATSGSCETETCCTETKDSCVSDERRPITAEMLWKSEGSLDGKCCEKENCDMDNSNSEETFSSCLNGRVESRPVKTDMELCFEKCFDDGECDDIGRRTSVDGFIKDDNEEGILCNALSGSNTCSARLDNPSKSLQEKNGFIEGTDENAIKKNDSCCKKTEFSDDCNKKSKTNQACCEKEMAKLCERGKDNESFDSCCEGSYQLKKDLEAAFVVSSDGDELRLDGNNFRAEKDSYCTEASSDCCKEEVKVQVKEEPSTCCKKGIRFNVSSSDKKERLTSVENGARIVTPESHIENNASKCSCCEVKVDETLFENEHQGGNAKKQAKSCCKKKENKGFEEDGDHSPKVGRKLLTDMGNKVSYGSISCCDEVKKNQGRGYALLPDSSIEVDSKIDETCVEIKPPVITTTKLRIQNICCGKEAELMKRELDPLNGVEAVSVNIVGRIGFVRHDKEIISAVQIVGLLNNLHLGVSIMESGQHDAEQELRKEVIMKLAVKCTVLAVLLALFAVVIVGRVYDYSWQKWVAIAEIIIGCLPILRKVLLNWRKKVFIDINGLMLIAVAGTIALNEWVEGATLVFVFAVSEVLQQYCGYRVQAAISGIMVHVPDHAVLADTGKSVPVEEIEVGSRILVCAGEKIALDGDVVKGQASVDESSITGESMPIEKGPGNKTYSGTIVQSGYLEIKTTSTADESTVSKVSQMVQEAQAKSSHTEKMMNQFAKFYTPLVLVIALLVFAIPAVLAELKVGTYADQLHWWGIRALIVLLIACPCALVMSVPIPMVCGITTAAKNGALVKGGTDMELLAGIKAIAFDKTGTLTEGRFKVVNLKEFKGDMKYNDIIQMVASLEVKSSHPVAAAIVNHYSGCITDKIANFGAGVGLPDVKNFKTVPGLGLTGWVCGHSVAVGNLKMLRTSGVTILSEAEKLFNSWSESGQTVIFCSIDGQLALMMGLSDTPRATSKLALGILKELGISTIILTGDSSGAAAAVMKAVGAENYIASMKPEHKLDWIRNRQKTNNKRTKVAMIGDGVNDGPSLAAADIGIAIGACATALAIESANVALMSDSLVKIPELIVLSKFTRKIVIQNMGLALAIKVVVIIATMAGALTLWMAILSDVLALLLVILNGLRPLLWKRSNLKVGFDARDTVRFEVKDGDVVDSDDEGMAFIEIKS